MTPREEIQIIDLLAGREAAFRTVSRCEAEISALLGGLDYPYPPLPDLPSRRPRQPQKKTVKKPVISGRQATAVPEWLRELDASSEDAYRVEYFLSDTDELQASFHTDSNVIASALEMRENGLRLSRVVTVRLTATENWQEVSVLYDERN